MIRFALALLFVAPALAAEKPTLFVVGDSTAKNGTKGQQGWGDPFVALFDKEKVNVENHASSGRSSRSFQAEGRWDKVLAASKPGDFVLVQMGHNDGVPVDDTARPKGTIPGIGEETREIDNPVTKNKDVVHTYSWYLRKYVADARAKGMSIVLLSPIPHAQRTEVKVGDVELSNYAVWSEAVASAEKVPFVHVNRLVTAKYVGLKVSEIKSRYFTEADNGHTSPAGAELNARCVVEGLCGLKDSPFKDLVLPTGR